jgi:hypothetical protein
MASPEFKYYSDHVDCPGFENQRLFCLEYKKLRPNRNLIEFDEINPMTVQLMAVKQALDDIIKTLMPIDELHDKTTELKNKDDIHEFQPKMHSFSSLSGSAVTCLFFESDASPQTLGTGFTIVSTSSPAYQSLVPPGKFWFVTNFNSIPHYKLYVSLYQFVLNYATILDRLALELQEVYLSNGTWQGLHFTYLIHKESEWLKKQLSKEIDSKCSLIIPRINSIFRKSPYMKYILLLRHSFAHRGYVELKVDDNTCKFYLPDNPKSVQATHVNLREIRQTCTHSFSNLLEILNDVYYYMWGDIGCGIV